MYLLSGAWSIYVALVILNTCKQKVLVNTKEKLEKKKKTVLFISILHLLQPDYQ